MFDLVAALSEIAEAIKLLPATGPNNTVTTEHRCLHERVDKSATLLQGVVQLLDERFCLLVATSASPHNKSLLSALTARVRSSAYDTVLSHEGVRKAYQDLEAKRAEELFKAAAKYEVSHKAKAGAQESSRPWQQQQQRGRGAGYRGRGRGRGNPAEVPPAEEAAAQV